MTPGGPAGNSVPACFYGEKSGTQKATDRLRSRDAAAGWLWQRRPGDELPGAAGHLAPMWPPGRPHGGVDCKASFRAATWAPPHPPWGHGLHPHGSVPFLHGCPQPPHCCCSVVSHPVRSGWISDVPSTEKPGPEHGVQTPGQERCCPGGLRRPWRDTAQAGTGEGLDLAVAVPGGTHSGHLSPACTAGVTKWEMFPVAKAQRPRGVLLGEAWAEATAFPGPFSRVGPAVLVFSMFAEGTLGSVKAPAAMTTDPFC